MYGHVNLKPLPNDAQPKEVMMPLSEVAEGVETDEEGECKQQVRQIITFLHFAKLVRLVFKFGTISR